MKSIQTCTEPHRCGPADVLMQKCLRMDQLRGPVRQKLRGGRRNLSFNVIICVIYYQHVRCSLPSFSAGVTEDRLWPSCSAEFINQGAQFIRSTWFINTFAELSKRYNFLYFLLAPRDRSAAPQPCRVYNTARSDSTRLGRRCDVQL